MKTDSLAKIKNVIWAKRLVLAAFFIPAAIMTAAFATMGICPFGSNQIAVIDFYHQYLPLIEEFQYKLQHGESLFYTWNGAGGCNFWNVIAYQAASPLNLILIIVPEKFLVEGLTAILILRIGLAGSFMYWFLSRTSSRTDFATVGFSSLYALCAYVVAYYWNIMWMDAVMLLPLVIAGLLRLVDGGKGILYSVTLAVLVFSNYYIGILVCVFILTYYFALYFMKKRDGGFREFLRTSLRTAFYSILAIAMAAVMILPTWLSMKKSSAMNSEFPDHGFFYNDPLDIFNQLLPLSKNCYMEGLPNVGCGMVAVMMLAAYFISRSIPLRSKIVNALYLAFLFFSLNVNYFDYIWHGFHYPNMLPYRYAFAVSFVILRMAHEAFVNIDSLKLKHLWAIFAAILGYYLIAQKLLVTSVDDMDMFFYAGVALLSSYTLLIGAVKKKMLKTKVFRYVFVAVVTAELCCVTITNVNMIGSTDKSDYQQNSSDIAKSVEKISDEFCRVEIDDSLTLNEPARFHYRGMSQFASSINSVTNSFYEKIGLEAESASNRCRYVETNPVTNAMLNIKYVIAKNTKLEDDSFKAAGRSGNTRLYENTQPLGIGYMLPESIHTWNYDSENPFDNLNDYVRAATANECEDVFHQIELSDVKGIGAEVEESGSDSWQVSAEDTGISAEAQITFKSDESRKYYVLIECEAAECISLKKEGEKKGIEIEEDYGSIVNIGEVEAGKSCTIDVQYELGKSGTVECHICYMDEAMWNKAYGIISKNTMKVTDFSETSLKGTVTADETGVFVTSVPCDEGWTLKVDGEKREIMDPVGDVWIATPLEAGTHEISLTFRPPGFIAGLVISVMSVLLLVIIGTRKKKVVKLYV